MKVVVPVLVLAAAAAAATLEIASILEQAGPILLKAMCALPCLDLAANKLPCSGGPVDTVCAGLGTIQALAAPCLAKCGIDAKLQGKKDNGHEKKKQLVHNHGVCVCVCVCRLLTCAFYFVQTGCSSIPRTVATSAPITLGSRTGWTVDWSRRHRVEHTGRWRVGCLRRRTVTMAVIKDRCWYLGSIERATV